MMEEDKGSLPPKKDFSSWYNEILWRAEVMDVRYPVKGLYVWYPHGFGIRKLTYGYLRHLLDRDHEETLFPLLIPEYEFMKEAEHIKGFEEEVYWVTHGGLSELDVKLALRPTSETAIYPMYALWLRSHVDLPMKYYQIVNTFRYETKHTRPLIRLREITSFKEAHTVHATWEDAKAQVDEAIDLYQRFYQHLCIPVIISRRPDWDKFPGADYTMAVDAIMPDGKTLQVGTVHHLADNFSKTFEIMYEDAEGERQYAHQTCYGISERCIAATIGVHGDDKGLVIPCGVAPTQVVIVPVIMKKREDEVLEESRLIEEELLAAGVRVKRDTRDMRPGAKYYHWEMKGIPLRLEIGPRDIDNGVVVAVNRLGNKEIINRESLVDALRDQLNTFDDALMQQAKDRFKSMIRPASTLEEIRECVSDGVALIHWCGSEECAAAIEQATDGSVLGTDIHIEGMERGKGGCPICGAEGDPAVVGRSY